MDAVVIGVPGARLSLAPVENKSAACWPAEVTYEAGSVSGSIQAELMSGGSSRWADQLEALHATLTGEAKLQALEDELRVRLVCTERGRLEGDVEIRLVGAGDPRGARITFRINLDQSYLPQMIAAARENFPGL